ncbi:MAG TPA: thioester domain-containing protein, partial [Chloroflexota bacterium]
MNERYEGTDRTTQLRKAYARASRRGGRRDLWAAGLVAVGLLCLMLVPALAETQHTYRLQGANIATEFVVQPYWLASGSLDGHHFRFESGLIGFTDGQGVPGTGYCIDARTHRQHAASYTDGANLDAAGINNSRQILWLLRNAYPKGPALLGDDPRGLARSSSAVQAAIWYFSDGFQLDPAGAPYVDAAYRGAYDRLIAEANAAPAPAHGHMTLTGPSGIVSINSLPADHGVDVTANVILDDGSTVADGTEVSLSSDDGNLSLPGQAGVPHPASSPLLLRTVAGHVTAHLVVAAAATKHVTISATAELPTAPGKVLNPNVASQRLVETSWGKETASAQVGLDFTAHAVPTITKSVRDMSTTKGVALADTQNPAILAKTGDHLRYQIACGNSGLVPYSGTVVDELAAPMNLNMSLLQNIHGFVVGTDGKEVAAPASASTLRWPASVAPGTGCTVGFEADIPKALSAPTTSFVNCAYVLAPGAHPGSASSNCVTVVV